MLPEFWSLRRDASTKDFKDFSTVPRIGMDEPAWECQAMQSYVDGDVLKIARMSMPQRNGRTVLWMGQRGHPASDIVDPLEKALSSGKLDTSQLLAHGNPPSSCRAGTNTAHFGNAASWGTSSLSR